MNAEVISIIKNLPGVNQEAFNASIKKHAVAISLIDANELIEVISILDSCQVDYVKKSGIADFSMLSMSKEEALVYSEINNNVISLDDYLLDSSHGRGVA